MFGGSPGPGASATSTSATSRASSPATTRALSTKATSTWRRSFASFGDENFKGVLIPDHTPAMACEFSWHAGKAFALGYMRALVNNADALGASWSLNTAVAAE